jgi:hypothetical protein
MQAFGKFWHCAKGTALNNVEKEIIIKIKNYKIFQNLSTHKRHKRRVFLRDKKVEVFAGWMFVVECAI